MSNSKLTENNSEWTVVVKPTSKFFEFKFGEILKYKDLLYLLIRRDIIVKYKQTILGPLWIFIQPIFTTVTFVIVFSKFANISTNGLPPVLFYLSGNILWLLVSDSIRENSDSFKKNVNVFSKVYFPRIIVPLATTGTILFQFFMQFCLFMLFFGYYSFKGYNFSWGLSVLLIPVLLFFALLFSLGLGLLLSSFTYKYRDFQFLVSFGINLVMYITPVIYPLSSVPESLSTLVMINPITSIMEAFRFILLNQGVLSWGGLLYSSIASLLLFFTGMVVFNRTERNFMDTV